MSYSQFGALAFHSFSPGIVPAIKNICLYYASFSFLLANLLTLSSFVPKIHTTVQKPKNRPESKASSAALFRPH